MLDRVDSSFRTPLHRKAKLNLLFGLKPFRFRSSALLLGHRLRELVFWVRLMHGVLHRHHHRVEVIVWVELAIGLHRIARELIAVHAIRRILHMLIILRVTLAIFGLIVHFSIPFLFFSGEEVVVLRKRLAVGHLLHHLWWGHEIWHCHLWVWHHWHICHHGPVLLSALACKSLRPQLLQQLSAFSLASLAFHILTEILIDQAALAHRNSSPAPTNGSKYLCIFFVTEIALLHQSRGMTLIIDCKLSIIQRINRPFL